MNDVILKKLVIDVPSAMKVQQYLPAQKTLLSMADLFKVLSDTTRLKILSALSITPMCVGDISLLLGINQTTVSHQLRLLKNLGIVKSERSGKIIFYSLVSDLVNDVMLKGVEFLGM